MTIWKLFNPGNYGLLHDYNKLRSLHLISLLFNTLIFVDLCVVVEIKMLTGPFPEKKILNFIPKTSNIDY